MNGSIFLTLLITLAQVCFGEPPRYPGISSWSSMRSPSRLASPASSPTPAGIPSRASLPSRIGSTRINPSPPSSNYDSSAGTGSYSPAKPSPLNSGLGGSFKSNTLQKSPSSSKVDQWNARDSGYDQPKFQNDSAYNSPARSDSRAPSGNASGNGFTFSHASPDGRNVDVEVSANGTIPEGMEKFEEHIRKAVDSVLGQGNKDKVPLMSRVL